jgi:hypothetical protein
MVFLPFILTNGKQFSEAENLFKQSEGIFESKCSFGAFLKKFHIILFVFYQLRMMQSIKILTSQNGIV